MKTSERLKKMLEEKLDCQVLSVERIYGWGPGSSKWAATIKREGQSAQEILSEDTMTDCVKWGLDELRPVPWGTSLFIDAKISA